MSSTKAFFQNIKIIYIPKQKTEEINHLSQRCIQAQLRIDELVSENANLSKALEDKQREQQVSNDLFTPTSSKTLTSIENIHVLLVAGKSARKVCCIAERIEANVRQAERNEGPERVLRV